MTAQEERIVFPELQHYSDFPLYNTKAVVQQTGIPAPTLRAWERRYGLLSPERANNAYRRYSERDIVIIRWLKERVDAGMSISQAIALFHHLEEERRQSGLSQEQVSPAESAAPFQVALPTSLEKEQTQPPPAGNLAVTGVLPSGETTPSLWKIPRAGIEKKPGAYPATHNLRLVKERLLEAFNILDESTAGKLMASVLAIYTIEEVCAELITPTLWEIGRLWEQGKITVSVEHFASAFFRGVLTNLLHVTPDPGPGTAPLVVVCCAPGEAHELAPLMLSLLLRRSGMHIVYLGQSIETAGLLETIRQMAPAIICISLTMPYYLEALIDLGHKVQELPPPRPMLVLGGQGFELHKEAISQVPGIYLSGSINSAIAQLRRIIAEQQARG